MFFYIYRIIILLFASNLIFFSLVNAKKLDSFINSDNRTPSYKERDKFRNPKQTLTFFKIKNNMKVIELQPSGGNSPGGWYTEILAPFLKEEGLLIAAHFNPEEAEWRAKMRMNFIDRIKNNNDFKKIKMAVLSMPPIKLAEDESIDMVLTFRNLHNWLKSGYLKEVYEVSFQALKPGGIFGIVEHRAPENFTTAEMKKSGYVTESLAIKLAMEVGFLLEEKSDINANILDKKNHPNGVWNLPPTLKINDSQDKQKFLDIGESDRMTLRFIKPINN
tara:strand:- start:1140 stop:1967 length:828 start_codon:yes stop_codon:yes gene_type:complete